jgi:hypothetical protein
MLLQRLFLAEAHRLLHGNGELMLQVGLVLVLGEVQAVEAGQVSRIRGTGKGYLPSMRLWQRFVGARLFNRKSAWTIASLEILEAIDGNARGASRKL